MGGSRRKTNRTRPKITIKKKRQPMSNTKVPEELTSKRPDIAGKLHRQPDWDRKKTFEANYKNTGFLADPNTGFGRNSSRADPLQERLEELEQGDGEVPESDDDLRALEGKERRSGKAAPQRLTTHQTQVMQRLIATHGTDIEAMVRDTKLNAMLLPASKLRKMLASLQRWGERGRCGFRVPTKRLW